MRHLIYTFFSSILLCLPIITAAQDIPNADMETWIKFGTFEDPQHWTTPNQTTSPLFVFSVTKETKDVYSGDYAARLESMPILGGMVVIPGFMTIGDFDVNTTTMEYKVFGGIPFTKRPLRLKGFNKYWPQDGDKWFIAVYSFKYDAITMKQDTIGVGFYESGSTDSLWTPFEVFFNYGSQEAPDSMNIIILTTRNETPPTGSLLLIDSLWFDYAPSSINENTPGFDFQIYPNPATSQVFIKQKDARKSTLLIHNLYGQKVFEQGIFEKENMIDLSHLPKGMYTMSYISDGSKSQKKLILK